MACGVVKKCALVLSKLLRLMQFESCLWPMRGKIGIKLWST